MPAYTNVDGFQHFSSIALPPYCSATTTVQLAVTMSHLKACCACNLLCMHAAISDDSQ